MTQELKDAMDAARTAGETAAEQMKRGADCE
jgi:hypothetical protein